MSAVLGANCATFGPFIKATLSLYAETISFGNCFDVSFINLNNDVGISSPSITKVPLNILCLQCSEFTWLKPNTSESVNFLPIFVAISSKYVTSSALKERPSSLLYAAISSIFKIGSGWISIENDSCSKLLNFSEIIGSKSVKSSKTAVNSSILMMPLIPIFWVISTALVLQGVIIAALGPTKNVSIDVSSIFGWLANNQVNLETVVAVNSFVVWTAYTLLSLFPKKWIIIILC